MAATISAIVFCVTPSSPGRCEPASLSLISCRSRSLRFRTTILTFQPKLGRCVFAHAIVLLPAEANGFQRRVPMDRRRVSTIAGCIYLIDSRLNLEQLAYQWFTNQRLADQGAAWRV